MPKEFQPRLVALSGPLRGQTFQLSGEETSVGRSKANEVHLPAPTVSRKHFLIRNRGAEFNIVDLDSSQGTFVNGIPVHERALVSGDQIAAGESILLFLTGDDDAVSAEHAVAEVDDFPTGQTQELTPEQVLYLDPERAREAAAGNPRIAGELSLLLRISRTIGNCTGTTELQERILEMMLEVFPARRAAIILAPGGTPDFSEAATRWSSPDRARPEGFSKSATRHVLESRNALLSNDVVERAGDAAASLVGTGVCSILCVPLEASGECRGVLYLDSADASAQFDDGHLQLAAAIASIAAAALATTSRVENLETEARSLREAAAGDHQMVGESPAIQKIRRMIDTVGPKDTTVLIRGETGTGKELVARALHEASPRSKRPFVALNCAVLSESLLESELFGHEKGAFTGAVARKIGKLEAAAGGSVFLDEIGDMAASLQAKMLRVLQERVFERVGGTTPIKADIRLIAATHVDLEEAIRQGTFRSDLFYRINVVTIAVPPLRERREDIPLLASHFLARFRARFGSRVTGLSAEARTRLQTHDWPGNIRELQNAIERAVVMGEGDQLDMEDLPENILEGGGGTGPEMITGYHKAVKEAKRKVILSALQAAGGNFTQAAKALGVHANYLHRLVKNLGIRDEVDGLGKG